MGIINEILNNVIVIVASTLFSLGIIGGALYLAYIKYIKPKLANVGNIINMPLFVEDEDIKHEDKPLLMSYNNRKMNEEIDSSTNNEVTAIYNAFLNGEPMSINQTEYDTHREMDFGPPITCGLD